jgi:hypothetical protein
MYARAQALVATKLEPLWEDYRTTMVHSLGKVTAEDSVHARRQDRLQELAQPPKSVMEEAKRMREQLLLQIAMEQLTLVILTMFDESEYRQIVEDALWVKGLAWPGPAGVGFLFTGCFLGGCLSPYWATLGRFGQRADESFGRRFCGLFLIFFGFRLGHVTLDSLKTHASD